MKFDTAYIIHYLPNQPEERRLRREAHYQQVAYWLDKGFKLVIVATNLNSDDFINSDDIRYIVTPKLGIANSRNILLREFYASDQDFGVFLDDDIILDDSVGSGEFLQTFRETDVAHVGDIDMFSPIHPTWHGRDAVEVLFATFVANPRQAGHSMFLKNLRLHYGVEFYFKNEWAPQPWEPRCGEDVVFGLDLFLAGYGVYDCYNMLKVVSGDDISTWLEDPSSREEMVKRFEARLAKEYDLPIKDGCGVDWDAVLLLDPLSEYH